MERVRPRIAELFGKQTFDDAEDLLKQLKNGIVATRTGADGSVQYIPMKNRDNVVTWFKGLEKLRTEVLKRQDKESRKDFDGSIQYIPIKNRDNVVMWFKGLEKLRTQVLNRQDKESRKDFEPCQWPQMVLHASKKSMITVVVSALCNKQLPINQ